VLHCTVLCCSACLLSALRETTTWLSDARGGGLNRLQDLGAAEETDRTLPGLFNALLYCTVLCCTACFLRQASDGDEDDFSLSWTGHARPRHDRAGPWDTAMVHHGASYPPWV